MLMTKGMVNKTLADMKLSPSVMYSDEVYKRRRMANAVCTPEMKAPKSA